MNKIVVSCFIIAGMLFAASVFKPANRQVQASVSEQFTIPTGCEHIALIGCTPHPTEYLKQHNNDPSCLKTIRIHDFLDREYLADSYERTCLICKEQQVDHLIIAYLPIYFMRMRALLGDQFVRCCRKFLSNIKNDMVAVIEAAAQKVGYTGQVTLILPSDQQLSRVPTDLTEKEDRVRYLIKQFPFFINRGTSQLKRVTIINNEDSSADDMITSYLKYEYLYDSPVAYATCSTGKKQFHKGKA